MKIEGKRQNERNGTSSFEVQKVDKVFGAARRLYLAITAGGAICQLPSNGGQLGTIASCSG
jgi:hypothetical protein